MVRSETAHERGDADRGHADRGDADRYDADRYGADRYDALAAALGGRAARHQPVGALTTYGVGGRAELLVEVAGPEDLDEVRTALAGSGVAVCVIGRGSNLLVADGGFDGVVLRLGPGFTSIQLPEAAPGPPFVVRAGGAVPLPVLARQAAEAGWAGLTWAVGVPGSVGGAVRMNAGGHGSDVAGCLLRYTWVDLLSHDGGTDDASRLHFAYRSSSVVASQVVVEAEFAVTPGDGEAERAEISAIVRWRREHQPGGSNAGSVFTNPVGDSAGRLIEEAGLKGFRLGTAHVSEKHANFIQADKGGRADDVRALMEHVRATVLEHSGVSLTAEVRLLGFAEGETTGMEATGEHVS
jgi:UDP-N-acetylmuramate dehydrogenase